MFCRITNTLALLALSTGAAFSQQVLAPTPPMGWNSWDSFGTGVTEDEVKANADYMASKLAKARLAVHRGGHPMVGAEPEDPRLPSRKRSWSWTPMAA